VSNYTCEQTKVGRVSDNAEGNGAIGTHYRVSKKQSIKKLNDYERRGLSPYGNVNLLGGSGCSIVNGVIVI